MSDFERVYQIDPYRETHHARERHPSIELSDHEYLEKQGFIRSGHYVKFNTGPKFDDTPLRVSKDMEEAGFTYKEPPDEESMSPALKEKFKKAKKICQDTKVIDLQASPPSLILMNMELPKLEKSKKNVKNKRGLA